MFPVVQVQPQAAESLEQLGTKEKFWYTDPEHGRCLCKFSRPGTGEDWAEKITSELAEMLGLPHAVYELAVCDEKPCVVTPRFVPADGSLIHGNELLSQLSDSYMAAVSNFRQSSHTVEAVLDVLGPGVFGLPPDWTPPAGVGSAVDLFVGYLLLDAFVGNTDRHHENWGIILDRGVDRPRGARMYLAPTFDHASSLGCHLSEEGKAARLRTRDQGFSVTAFATRARSALYREAGDAHPLSTVDAFLLAARHASEAVPAWLARLEGIREEEIDILFGRVPPERMTPVSADFAKEILRCNKRRLVMTSGAP